MANNRTDILVVDDDSGIRAGLKRRLEHAGYVVTAAKCGADAIFHCDAHCPDIVILDVAMPDIDGFEVCDCIRTRHADRNIAVIFLAGATDPMTRTNLGQMVEYVGGDYILVKPYDPEVLLTMVDDIVQQLKGEEPALA